MKFTPKALPRAVAGAMSVSVMASLIILPAAAQTPATPPADKQVEKVEQVVVTGTRIKTPGVVSNSPITSVGTEEIKSSQPAAVEEFIKTLPSAVPAIGPGTNNGSGGGATIDLRGLGSNRALVLLDGRRFVPFNLNGSVDTNSIPLALLQRVDLVTGGASAVYGADAVTGVVNFVLNKNFRGVDFSHTYGVSAEGDAKRNRTDVTIGAGLADGRGNVALSVGNTETQALRQDARRIGLSALSSTNGLPQGSGTTVPSTFQVPAVAGVTPNPLAGTTQIDPATGRLVPVFNTFNFNPDNFYVTPLDRMQASAIGNYVINNHVEAYAQVFYTRSDVRQQLASSGTFLNVFNVPIGNPFIPEAARAQICAARGIPAAQCVVGNTTEVPMAIGRRITELGPRLGDFLNKTAQGTVGVRGDIINNWSYDAYFTHGESDQTRILGNWGSLSKVQQALRAVTRTACTNPANGCVPLNVFGPEGSITPTMINFINLSSVQLQAVEQRILSGSVSGDLGDKVKSPMASSPISVAFGLENRKVSAGNFSDGASQIQGEVLGTGAPLPDRQGSFELKEFMAEAQIPLIQDKPFARSLVLETGYRRTEFSTASSQSYNTYKYGGEWEPVQGLRFRGMFQRATRAPNINELFQPLVTGLSNLAVDPCQGNRINAADATRAGTLSNLCVQTGVPVGQVGSIPAPSAGQINNLTGGNPSLGPEEAETQTIGLVFQPAAVRGLSMTLDYYKIDLAKAISSPSTTDILNDCYDPARNPTFSFNASCQQIFRGAFGTFNGSDARGVFTPQSNLGTVNTEGIDFTANYGFAFKDLKMNPRLGRLDMSINVNQTRKYKFKATPTAIDRDCLGYYSVACQTNLGLLPKTKFNQRTTWTFGDFVLGYNWRYQSSVSVEPGSGTFFSDFTKIKAFHYVDTSLVWNATKNVRLNLSVTNLFDKDAPNVGNTIGTTGTNSGNTFPQNYDLVGRYYSIGATLRF
jgi:iron complex outermembrane recepter protein